MRRLGRQVKRSKQCSSVPFFQGKARRLLSPESAQLGAPQAVPIKRLFAVLGERVSETRSIQSATSERERNTPVGGRINVEWGDRSNEGHELAFQAICVSTMRGKEQSGHGVFSYPISFTAKYPPNQSAQLSIAANFPQVLHHLFVALFDPKLLGGKTMYQRASCSGQVT